MELALKTHHFTVATCDHPAPPLPPPSPKKAELRNTRVDVQQLGRKVRLEVNGCMFQWLGGRGPRVETTWFNWYTCFKEQNVWMIFYFGRGGWYFFDVWWWNNWWFGVLMRTQLVMWSKVAKECFEVNVYRLHPRNLTHILKMTPCVKGDTCSKAHHVWYLYIRQIPGVWCLESVLTVLQSIKSKVENCLNPMLEVFLRRNQILDEFLLKA